jgi:hypothetical protein
MAGQRWWGTAMRGIGGDLEMICAVESRRLLRRVWCMER